MSINIMLWGVMYVIKVMFVTSHDMYLTIKISEFD